jgi:hypothetical protein
MRYNKARRYGRAETCIVEFGEGSLAIEAVALKGRSG